jgi:ketosteroid isomerase-like protein
MSRADDWIEIYELKSSYYWYYDSPDLEALVGLFTDDAVCEFGAYGTWTGIDEIRAGFTENVSASDNNFPSLHAVTNGKIAVDGDSATGQWYLLDTVLTGAPGEPSIRVCGVYYERYRREGGRWLIAHSHLKFLWNSDVGRILPGEERKLEWHADEG